MIVSSCIFLKERNNAIARTGTIKMKSVKKYIGSDSVMENVMVIELISVTYLRMTVKSHIVLSPTIGYKPKNLMLLPRYQIHTLK
mgnify:CR=1 FL=1